MAEVRELDTLGAWLLEKMSRRATSAGHRADIVGIADNYAGLIDEVRQVNRRTPAPAPARNPVVAKLGDIGRATIGAREDVAAFLQMLGALCIAILGVLRRPRSLRLTSLTYQLYRVGWQAIPDRRADHLPDRRHHRAAGHFPFPQVRRGFLRRRHGRHSRAARTRRADRRHHGRRAARAAPIPPNSAR